MDKLTLDGHIEEIARAWASIDGKAEKFDACKVDPALEEESGHYEGYVTEATELLRRSPITLHAICAAKKE
jgi:hypothetical protein